MSREFRTVNEGEKYGRWLVVSKACRKKYNCLCECGVEREVFKLSLYKGTSKSCGCLNKEVARATATERAVRIKAEGGRFFGDTPRTFTDEERQLISKRVASAWANGVYAPSQFESAVKAMKEANAGNPANGGTAMGVGNAHAKYWRLRAPDGSIVEGVNLFEIVRQNTHRFAPDDIKWRTSKYGRPIGCRAVTGLTHLFLSTKRRLLSWKGWTAIAHHEVAKP